MEIDFQPVTKLTRAGRERLRLAVIAALRANTMRRIAGVNDPVLVEVRATAQGALHKAASRTTARALRAEIVARLAPVGLGYIYP
jgi:hypothetical protein